MDSMGLVPIFFMASVNCTLQLLHIHAKNLLIYTSIHSIILIANDNLYQ